MSALMASMKCVAHCVDSACWDTSANGTCILSGTLTGCHLHAISGGQITASHVFLATQAPILETWHHCLGHANYRAVSELFTQCRSVRTHGTLAPSSSPPPACEHCILGKQTRSSIPKVREGVRVN
jgi:hypothetical protein